MSGPRSLRFDLSRALATALAGSLVVGGAVAPAGAQALKPSITGNPPSTDDLKQRDQELEVIRAEQRKATEAQAKLKREIAELGENRSALNQQLIDTAGRVRDVEGRIQATEERLKPLDDKERTIRQSLDGRRAIIAEILAALQRIGRRPLPAVMVRPEDALQSVRTAMLLGAVLPEMRAEAETLIGELTALVRVRKDIAEERSRLAADLASISADRERLALLVEERQKTQIASEKALADQRQHAAVLARQVDNLKDLIGKLEQGLDKSTRAAREAARSAEDAKTNTEGRPGLAALTDPGRLAPAVAFASIRGRLPMPVNGVRIREFGRPDSVGGLEKGLSVATRAGAQVTAPNDGWVVYAGPFRSYGQLLILNAGGGYHILLAGMERISVELGQFVLTGEPVAIMGSGSPIAGTSAGPGVSQPVLYVEFRKDGTPVDPGPWWANSEGEKVRG
jgi:septal ring factor EnvC (AmiA/AmiB activator)